VEKIKTLGLHMAYLAAAMACPSSWKIPHAKIELNKYPMSPNGTLTPGMTTVSTCIKS